MRPLPANSPPRPECVAHPRLHLRVHHVSRVLALRDPPRHHPSAPRAPRAHTGRPPPGTLRVRHVSREVKTLFPADFSKSRNLLELCKCILNGIMLRKI